MIRLTPKRDRRREVDILVDVNHIGADLVGLVVHVIDRAVRHVLIADPEIVVPVSIRAHNRADVRAGWLVLRKIDFIVENQPYWFIVRVQLDRRARCSAAAEQYDWYVFKYYFHSEVLVYSLFR